MSVLERLEAIERKLEQMVVRGTIAKVDCDAKRVTVAWGDGLESDWIEWKPTRSGQVTIWSPPQVGEGVTVISDGDINQGEAFLGSYHNSMPSPSSDPDEVVMKMPDGTVFTYNHKAHKLKVEVKGDTLIDVVGNIDAKATGSITASSEASVSVSAKGKASVTSDGPCELVAKAGVLLKGGSGVSVEGGGSGSMSASSGGIKLGAGGGAGVVTGNHVCAYTGKPHAACSSTVFAAG